MPMFPPGRPQYTNIQPINANGNKKLNCQRLQPRIWQRRRGNLFGVRSRDYSRTTTLITRMIDYAATFHSFPVTLPTNTLLSMRTNG